MSNPKLHPRFLDLTALVVGLATLAIEFAMRRLISNVFSTSNVVWAGVVGMALLYLMIGYFVGGYWADRVQSAATCYRILAWASLGIGLMPLLTRPILVLAANALQTLDLGTALASAIVIGALFFVPITLLGCVPSFLIKLSMHDVAQSGTVAGRLYALSTLGGLAGAFGATLVLVPVLGTPATFLICAASLIIIAWLGLHLAKELSWRFYVLPVILVLVAVPSLQRPLKPPPPNSTLLYEDESPYNYIQVVESNRTRYLVLNETLAVHSIYNPDQLITGQTWDYYTVAPYFNAAPYAPQKVQKVAILGLAAGTSARQLTAVYGPIAIDGIEIDPDIVEAGRRWFDMNQPNLNVIVGDARHSLTRLGGEYQIIGVDAYRPPYIPWHLTTQEFFQEARSHLAADGVLIINVGRTETDRRLVEALTATLLTVFPTVHTLDVPEAFNTMLIATVQPTVASNLEANAQALENNVHPVLENAFDLAISSLRPTTASDLVFTDDHAPVEFISDSLVLQYGLDGGEAEFPAHP